MRPGTRMRPSPRAQSTTDAFGERNRYAARWMADHGPAAKTAGAVIGHEIPGRPLAAGRPPSRRLGRILLAEKARTCMSSCAAVCESQRTQSHWPARRRPAVFCRNNLITASERPTRAFRSSNMLPHRPGTRVSRPKRSGFPTSVAAARCVRASTPPAVASPG